MLTPLSATDIALGMIAVMQGVFCGMWLLGSWVIGDARRAAQHWSAFAGLSALSIVAFAMALRQPAPLPAEYARALGNLFGLAAMIALHRGTRLFVDAPLPTGAYALAVGIVLVASWLGLSPAHASLRVSVMCAVLTVITLGIASDLYRYGRDVVRRRWTWLLMVPLVVAAAMLSARGVRALWRPESVSIVTADSAVNVGFAMTYMVIALTFQATLMGLVVGRLLADLRYRSRHDGLTGLLNRRAMEETLSSQVQRSRRTGEPFAVLMLDLDHFKDINDRHGHAAGDRALKHAAAAIKAELREVDAVGRFGGEEFLVLMPGATVETARPVAERVRTAVVADAPRVDGATLLLSASIGIAQWREPAEEPSRLVMRADAALYQAKLRGRDCVVVEASETEPLARPQPSEDGPITDAGLMMPLLTPWNLLSWRVNAVVVAALGSVSGLAWGATVADSHSMSAMAMGLGQIGYRDLPSMGAVPFLVMWVTMMAAMMLPTIAPVVLAHHAFAARRSESTLSTPAFVAGYMLIWSAIGIVVWLAYLAFAQWGDGAAQPWLSRLAAALLFIAGLYQFTPLKRRWADMCRSPLAFVSIHRSGHGTRDALRAGLANGAHCLGCCWAEMMVLVVVGLTNLPAMVTLSLLFLAEKNWKRGSAVGNAAGMGMMVLGVAVLAYPSLLAAISN